MYNHRLFLTLKECVLHQANIKQLIPSECRKLSLIIYSITRKRVSETTIKRIYGFALSKFNPSAFTLKVLAEFCGYNGWEDFCLAKEKSEDALLDVNLHDLYSRLNRITSFTLQTQKKRSGIPFDLTIKRQFVTDHFVAFKKSKKQATVFAGPSGYGKTISTCHLVEDLLQENTSEKPYKNVVLFFSTSLINNVVANDFNLGDWLLSFLGMQSERSIIDLFEGDHVKLDNFYLAIDGFDDHMFKPETYLAFFNQLIDLILFYSKFPSFNVILNMRSTTWLNYKYLVADNPLLLEKWDIGFVQDEHQMVNILPFSTDEILLLNQKINPSYRLKSLPSVKALRRLGNPFFYQLYYQNNVQNFDVTHFDDFNFFHIVSVFAESKIYHGANSMEKILLLKVFLETVNWQSSGYTLDKIKFSDMIKAYPISYRELISANILKEENFSHNLHYKEQISFCDQALLEYCLARKLYGWNNESLDQNLLIDLERLLGNTTIKIAVIKWMIWFIVLKNSFDELDVLAAANFNYLEKLEIITFTSKLLKQKFDITVSDAATDLELPDSVLNFFLSTTYISCDYERALQNLLNLKISNRYAIVINTILAFTKIVKMKADKAEYYINQLSEFPAVQFDDFMINPLLCLTTIFDYLKYGVVNKKGLQELTHLCYDDRNLKKIVANETGINNIMLKLALFTLKLNANPQKHLRFYKKVTSHMSLLPSEEQETISFFNWIISDRLFLELEKPISQSDLKKQMVLFSNWQLYPTKFKDLSIILLDQNFTKYFYSPTFFPQVKLYIDRALELGYDLAVAHLGLLYLSKVADNNETINADFVEIYNILNKLIWSGGFRINSFLTPQLKKKVESQLKDVA